MEKKLQISARQGSTLLYSGKCAKKRQRCQLFVAFQLLSQSSQKTTKQSAEKKYLRNIHTLHSRTAKKEGIRVRKENRKKSKGKSGMSWRNWQDYAISRHHPVTAIRNPQSAIRSTESVSVTPQLGGDHMTKDFPDVLGKFVAHREGQRVVGLPLTTSCILPLACPLSARHPASQPPTAPCSADSFRASPCPTIRERSEHTHCNSWTPQLEDTVGFECPFLQVIELFFGHTIII